MKATQGGTQTQLGNPFTLTLAADSLAPGGGGGRPGGYSSWRGTQPAAARPATIRSRLQKCAHRSATHVLQSILCATLYTPDSISSLAGAALLYC